MENEKLFFLMDDSDFTPDVPPQKVDDWNEYMNTYIKEKYGHLLTDEVLEKLAELDEKIKQRHPDAFVNN